MSSLRRLQERAETPQDAPLAITGFTVKDIERFAYRDIESTSDQTPKLTTNVTAAATAGVCKATWTTKTTGV